MLALAIVVSFPNPPCIQNDLADVAYAAQGDEDFEDEDGKDEDAKDEDFKDEDGREGRSDDDEDEED